MFLNYECVIEILVRTILTKLLAHRGPHQRDSGDSRHLLPMIDLNIGFIGFFRIEDFFRANDFEFVFAKISNNQQQIEERELMHPK